MDILTRYKIDWLKKKTVDTFDNTVVEVGWTIRGFNRTTGTRGTYSDSTQLDISSLTSGSFVDYATLTPETLFGWVEDTFTDETRATISGSIINEIERQEGQTTLVSENFPWEE